MRRRTLLLGLSLLPLNPANAQVSVELPATEDAVAPLELDAADFAHAWDLVEGNDILLVAADENLPDGYAEAFGEVTFAKFEDINTFFEKQTGNDFINFFNSRIAGKLHWAGKRIAGADVRANFQSYWTTVLAKGPVSATHFLCYMSVFINEIEGNLKSRIESFGSRGHPGIAYLFDTVAMKSANGRSWRKKSYNANRNLLQLLNDDLFLQDRMNLRFAQELARTDDPVWGLDAYPVGRYPTTGDLATTGIILEGDFFKFRGRGLIQTTWRANYAQLVAYAFANRSSSAAIAGFCDKHQGLTADQVCTLSTSQDWNDLFADPDRVMLAAAVQIHARSGGYLPLSSKGSVLNADPTVSGSIRAMGDRIGGRGYGANLKARVRQLCMQIGKP